ncbi:alpha-amylase family glycosyl hydrolase [Mycoplasma iguanae]|uniref:Alpha-amylase family glycosyl hydrolase n=1 Tax=Mycoplasma iguanae TaxID=292461 RepID=A0ABY5RAX9_9MOLU|nr:alpha-amylase family glycosyl hydrolase [Mycoplasma iguanae]UVD81907.1 alpha-amylase family glycosyl hydrolase [Mycoplasma iguanae]
MNLKQWKDKVIYQIFPKSFYDANNDGSGDLLGIIKKLDYIKSLNVDVIWLCPIYKTDFADAGYDVLDYFAIWEKFGTLADFELLVQEAKKRDMEIMLDIVLNHTSKSHPWFKKALESENNLEHNYYIWADKPNNAESIFGGSAWEYVPHLKKYYFHLFAKEQVDLNWSHPKTIEAMASIINFWYNLGIRCFRLDAIQHVNKEFTDQGVIHSFGENMVLYLQRFLDLILKDKKDILFVGEASAINHDKILQYAQGKDKISSSFYNFSWWWIGWSKSTGRNGYDANWKIQDFAHKDMIKIQNNKKIDTNFLTNFLTNHDTSRAISRWGNENIFWKESAKSLALLQFGTKGAQVIYFGEEIGMLNPNFQNCHEFRDVDALVAYDIFVNQKQVYSENEMTKYLAINGRDNSRYPMQWDKNKPNFGFNKGTKTWIKTGRSEKPNFVNEQENDPTSILNFYRQLTKLRQAPEYKDIWINGTQKMSLKANDLIIFQKTKANKKLLFLINISGKEILNIKKFNFTKLILDSYDDNKIFNYSLRPYESKVFFIEENKGNK